MDNPLVEGHRQLQKQMEPIYVSRSKERPQISQEIPKDLEAQRPLQKRKGPHLSRKSWLTQQAIAEENWNIFYESGSFQVVSTFARVSDDKRSIRQLSKKMGHNLIKRERTRIVGFRQEAQKMNGTANHKRETEHISRKKIQRIESQFTLENREERTLSPKWLPISWVRLDI